MRLIKPARLLTLALLGGLAGSVYAGGVPDSERITLSHFYDQTGGAGWIRDDNWGGPPARNAASSAWSATAIRRTSSASNSPRIN